MTNQNELRAKVFRFRKTLHWTQLQFSSAAKISRAKVSDWENAYVDLSEDECARVQDCFTAAFDERRKQLDHAEATLLGAGA